MLFHKKYIDLCLTIYFIYVSVDEWFGLSGFYFNKMVWNFRFENRISSKVKEISKETQLWDFLQFISSNILHCKLQQTIYVYSWDK